MVKDTNDVYFDPNEPAPTPTSAVFYYSDGTSSETNENIIRSSSYDSSKSLVGVEFGTSATRIDNSAFYECYSLTAVTIPNSVTSIGRAAFRSSGLTTAPELPATTLADECYRYMFNGCTSLNYIKCLTTNISASDCTKNWVSGVASSGTFVKDQSMTGWTRDVNGIPSNWIVEDAV